MTTSIIITNPQDWADESILLPHELIRNAILKMEKVFPKCIAVHLKLAQSSKHRPCHRSFEPNRPLVCNNIAFRLTTTLSNEVVTELQTLIVKHHENIRAYRSFSCELCQCLVTDNDSYVIIILCSLCR